MTKRRRVLTLCSVLLLLLFCHLVSWFYITDVYHLRFSLPGAHVVTYNLARAAFMLYLFWLIYWVGWAALKRLGDLTQLVAPERVLLCFLSGAGISHIVLFVAGLAGFYRVYYAAAAAIILLLFSLPHLRDCIDEMIGKMSSFARTSSPASRFGLLALLAAALAFLVIKVLYPGGGYDYFTHYFHFYNIVAKRGSTLPNEVWQHFFYSKGAGLYFFSMLLTDPLAPELVAGIFVFMATLALFLLVRRAGGSPLWAWMAATLYIGLQVYIQGTGYNNWGHLQKLHELNAALVMGLLWCSVMLRDRQGPRKLWIAALLLTLVCMTLLTSVMGLVCAVFLALFILLGNRALAGVALAGIVASLGTMLIVFAINYALTGIPEDHFIVLLWPYLSAPKILAWGTMLETFTCYWDQIVMRKVMAADRLSFSVSEARSLLFWMLRLDLLYALYFIAMLRFLWIGWRHKKEALARYQIDRDLSCYLAIIAAGSVFALTAGRVEVTSFYRFASFLFGPMLALGIIAIASGDRASGKNSGAFAAIVCALCLVMAYGSYRTVNVSGSAESALKFITGQYSIDDAYQHQPSLPVVTESGAIHPAARAAWQTVGHKTRIWALNSYVYCMLPNCRVETFMAFRLSRYPDQVLLGTPEQAQKTLAWEGLNYFIITPEAEIRDPLPRTTLFSPDHIAEYLGIVWTDGDAVLLTWKNKDTAPLSREWVERYRKQVVASGRVAQFPMDAFRDFYGALKEDSETLPPLPWDFR